MGWPFKFGKDKDKNQVQDSVEVSNTTVIKMSVTNAAASPDISIFDQFPPPVYPDSPINVILDWSPNTEPSSDINIIAPVTTTVDTYQDQSSDVWILPQPLIEDSDIPVNLDWENPTDTTSDTEIIVPPLPVQEPEYTETITIPDDDSEPTSEITIIPPETPPEPQSDIIIIPPPVTAEPASTTVTLDVPPIPEPQSDTIPDEPITPPEPQSDTIPDEPAPDEDKEVTLPSDDTVQQEPQPNAPPTPTISAEAIEALAVQAESNPDTVINTVDADLGAAPGVQALANRLKARKGNQEQPLRTMTDVELELELTGFMAHNSLDPQIPTEGSNKKVGDFFTLMQWGVRKNLTDYYSNIADAHPNDHEKIDSPRNGIPLYFKDLRDGAYIFFRAYVEGLSESVTPNWDSQTYIGRSEPVYTYTHGTRDVSFKLKLFAQSSDELDAIYEKLNRLTSLAYPAYKKHQTVNIDGKDVEVGSIGAKERMKPPLTKLRFGELWGDKDAELTGHIKTLAYNYSGPWETKRGKRVPKFIEVDITYQVIHGEVPSLNMAKIVRGGEVPDNTFYGISKTILTEKKEDLGF